MLMEGSACGYFACACIQPCECPKVRPHLSRQCSLIRKEKVAAMHRHAFQLEGQ